MATNSIHQITVIFTVTPPMSNDDAKIAFALSKPSMSETFCGGDRTGDQLRHTEVRALQDEERAQRDQEATGSPFAPPGTR